MRWIECYFIRRLIMSVDTMPSVYYLEGSISTQSSFTHQCVKHYNRRIAKRFVFIIYISLHILSSCFNEI